MHVESNHHSKYPGQLQNTGNILDTRLVDLYMTKLDFVNTPVWVGIINIIIFYSFHSHMTTIPFKMATLAMLVGNYAIIYIN